MKINRYLYNTIVVILPFILYFAVILIITKELSAIKVWILTILYLKIYILWGIIFASYFVIDLLYQKVRYSILVLPFPVIAITTFELIQNYGADAIMGFIMFFLPIVLASIIYPIGAILYNELYKPANNLTK